MEGAKDTSETDPPQWSDWTVMVLFTPSLIIRVLKEPAIDGEKQENREKTGNITMDEMVSNAQHLRHRAVAEDLSGTSVRSNGYLGCGPPCSWLPTSQHVMTSAAW